MLKYSFAGGIAALPFIFALCVIISIPLFILLIIRWILRYNLEKKRIEAGYYQNLAQGPAQAAKIQADIAAKRAYRNAIFLIIAGLVLYLLDKGITHTAGSILIIIGIMDYLSCVIP